MDYESDDTVSLAEPISQDDTQIILEAKQLIQKTKELIYKQTVGRQEETTDGSNLDGLHKYETMLYSIGNNLLQGLFDIDERPLKITPIRLWKIVTEEDLTPDSLIIIENEIRSQFIQRPYIRISANNI